MAEGLPVRTWSRGLIRLVQVIGGVAVLVLLYSAVDPSAGHNAPARFFLLGVVLAVVGVIVVGEIVARWLG